MTALATIEDVEAVSRLVPDGDLDRVDRLLDMVSAAVRVYTGQNFDPVDDDIVTILPVDGIVRVPQRPVMAVSSVAQGGAALAPEAYTWTPNGFIRRAWPMASNWPDDWSEGETWTADSGSRFGWWGTDIRRRGLWYGGPVTVTYDHGSAPDDIALVVAEVVAARYLALPEAVSVASKTVAGFQVAYHTPDATAGLWTGAQKAILDAYRRAGFASLRLTT